MHEASREQLLHVCIIVIASFAAFVSSSGCEECTIGATSPIEGYTPSQPGLEDDVVSLLHLRSIPHRRSLQPKAFDSKLVDAGIADSKVSAEMASVEKVADTVAMEKGAADTTAAHMAVAGKAAADKTAAEKPAGKTAGTVAHQRSLQPKISDSKLSATGTVQSTKDAAVALVAPVVLVPPVAPAAVVDLAAPVAQTSASTIAHHRILQSKTVNSTVPLMALSHAHQPIPAAASAWLFAPSLNVSGKAEDLLVDVKRQVHNKFFGILAASFAGVLLLLAISGIMICWWVKRKRDASMDKYIVKAGETIELTLPAYSSGSLWPDSRCVQEPGRDDQRLMHILKLKTNVGDHVCLCSRADHILVEEEHAPECTIPSETTPKLGSVFKVEGEGDQFGITLKTQRQWSVARGPCTKVMRRGQRHSYVMAPIKGFLPCTEVSKSVFVSTMLPLEYKQGDGKTSKSYVLYHESPDDPLAEAQFQRTAQNNPNEGELFCKVVCHEDCNVILASLIILAVDKLENESGDPRAVLSARSTEGG